MALELADGGDGDAVLEPEDDVEGKQGEDIGVVIVRPEGPADGVAEEADEFSLVGVAGDVDGCGNGVECRRLDLGEAFVDVGGADVALELADGGEGDAVLEPADYVEGRQGEDIGVVTIRPEGPADGVAAEEEADEFGLDGVTEDIDGSSNEVECRRLDPGEAFIDVGS